MSNGLQRTLDPLHSSWNRHKHFPMFFCSKNTLQSPSGRYICFFIDSLNFQVLLPHRREIDSLQKPDQDALALIKLCMAFLANKFRKPRVTVHLDPDQPLEVCVEQKRWLGHGVWLLVYNTEGIPRPFVEGVPQAARRKLPVTKPADSSRESTWGGITTWFHLTVLQ